jgi:hypothetical protein
MFSFGINQNFKESCPNSTPLCKTINCNWKSDDNKLLLGQDEKFKNIIQSPSISINNNSSLFVRKPKTFRKDCAILQKLKKNADKKNTEKIPIEKLSLQVLSQFIVINISYFLSFDEGIGFSRTCKLFNTVFNSKQYLCFCFATMFPQHIGLVQNIKQVLVDEHLLKNEKKRFNNKKFSSFAEYRNKFILEYYPQYTYLMYTFTDRGYEPDKSIKILPLDVRRVYLKLDIWLKNWQKTNNTMYAPSSFFENDAQNKKTYNLPNQFQNLIKSKTVIGCVNLPF